MIKNGCYCRFRKMWLTVQPRAIILFYHKIIELPSDPNLLSVTPRHFDEHLEYLRKHYQPMSLIDLSHVLTAKKIPRCTVIITLDDGYADNFWNAMPLLEQHKMPATIFVTTNYLGKNQEFWWDELEKIVLLPERLPEQLVFSIDGKSYEWDIYENNKQKSRQKVFWDIHHLLRNLEDGKQQQVLTELTQYIGVKKEVRPNYRALNINELKMLGRNGLVEIGSHTVSHPVLSALSPDMQRKEIVQSKRYLEKILGHPVNSFSYPHGQARDVGNVAIQLVKEAGYKVACSTHCASVTNYADHYWLPRFEVKDWGREEFAKQIKKFIGT